MNGNIKRMSAQVRRRPRLAALAAGLTLAGCATGASLSAGNALPGVALDAAGPSVFLRWDPEGPLAPQMRARSSVQIVASYPSARGPVNGEPIAQAVVDGSYSVLKFDLPDRLRFAPSGPVCLRLAMGGRAIPIRIPAAGQTSDGFVYSEWEEHASLGVRREEIVERMRIVDASLANVLAPADEFEAWRQSRGVADVGACETQAAQVNTKQPDTALTGAAAQDAARNHCVALFNRFPNDSLTFMDKGKSMRPGLTGRQLATEIRSAVPRSHALSGVADQLLADIGRYGAGEQLLTARGFAVDASTKVSIGISRGRVNASTAPALLESYSACLSEAQGRFESSYTSWRDTTSQLAQSGRSEELRRECRRRFQAEDARVAQVEQVQAEKAEIETELSALSSAVAPDLPTQKPLIPAACPALLRPA